MLIHRRSLLCAIVLLALASSAAFARGKGDQVQFGKSIQVGDTESAGSLVCVGCSIHVQGTCEDIAVVGGSVLIDGTVKGDIAVLGGSVRLTENAQVTGDVAVMGGHVSRDPGATIKGDVAQQGGAWVLPLVIIIPLIPVALLVALIWWLLKRPSRPVQPPPQYVGR